MALIVTAGYVTVETAVPGGRANVDIPRGEVLPDDVPDEQRENLLRLGHVEEAGEPTPAAPAEAAQNPATPPPRRGVGSGLDAWTAYAHSFGIPVPEGMKRDELIEQLAERGIPTE
jgi:hypothetical protein